LLVGRATFRLRRRLGIVGLHFRSSSRSAFVIALKDETLVGPMQGAPVAWRRGTVLLHHLRESCVYMDMRTETPLREPGASLDWAELRARLRSFVAPRVSSDPSIHEDLVQEILLRLHRGLPQLRETDRLDAFAYQVARNAITDHYRRARHEQPVAPERIEDHEVVEDGDDDELYEGRAQLARCLKPLVERLDDEYREALLLTDLGDLSQAEAARRLGLSGPGMRSRVQRGRSQLQGALASCCQVELDAASQIDEVKRVGPCACNS
jgi:RNA polymerase sigma-70 factor (ECF subfamily)